MRQARVRLKTAKDVKKDRMHSFSIRQSQECVELALKAALIYVGIEAPKWHDVGPVIKLNSNRYPEFFQKEVSRLVHISRKLRREREPSMYGDEVLGLSSDELYTEYDAEKAIEDAEFVFKISKKLIEG